MQQCILQAFIEINREVTTSVRDFMGSNPEGTCKNIVQ
jgi:hypothetical protein